MGASLKPSKGPLSPRQKLVGRLAVGVLALYLVTAATAASSPRSRGKLGWNISQARRRYAIIRRHAERLSGGPAMAAAPEMMMMEDASFDDLRCGRRR